jgi:polyhydroxybutyrate depolymerase
MNRLLTLSFLLVLQFSFSARAVPGLESLARREWKVDGETREALIYVPESAKSENVPIVFAFHGHGGSMTNAARLFGFHTHWPQAITVYMQGLNTPGILTDPEGRKPGWQRQPGDQKDRDLKFFDAVLASLKADYHVDQKRIYATGHSNGGGFTYVLWATRGDQFAAFAPSAAAAGKNLPMLKPKPLLHLAGENDPLVKFEWQEQTISAVRKLNKCEEGKPWHGEPGCTIYESKLGTPVVTFIHDGKHGYPLQSPDIVVRFFKEHVRQ